MGDTASQNAREIEKYLEYRPIVTEVSTRGEAQVRARKAKGSSKMPVTDRTTEWWEQEDNRDAAGYLNWRIEQLARTPTKWRGIWFSVLINKLYDEPGIIRTWRSEETEGDRRALAAFSKMCRLLADSLPPGMELVVQINPKALPAKDKRQAAALDREARRRASHARSHRLRYAGLQAIEREFPEITREAAKAIWSERFDMSVSTIRDSIRFCEKHEWPGVRGKHGGWQARGEPVAPEHRYYPDGEHPFDLPDGNGSAAA